MATIRTAIQIQDGMSPAFRSMNTALNIVLNSFESLQSASHNVIDTASIQNARNQMAQAEVAINSVEEQIRQANEESRRMPEHFNRASSSAGGLLNKVKGIAATMGIAFGGAKVIGLSDELAQTTARLNLMNDQQQTTAELQEKIFQAAQRSRGAYFETADVVAKLGQRAGNIFESNNETIAFAEQLNKMFVIAGANQQEVSSATVQLTQALGSGVLRGEEFNAVFEAAPNIMQTVADYMQVPIGSLREMAADGEITASTVKNALMSAVEETNATFESMPKTLAQVWTSIKNESLNAFQPVLQEINSIANSEPFNNMVSGIVGGLSMIAMYTTQVFNVAAATGSFIYDNWSIITPIIWGLVAAFIAYNAVSLITNGIIAFQIMAKAVHAAATMLQARETFAATVAQHGLNAALLACPITWIILAIIALIVIFYAVIAVVNKFAGTSISATGIIVGVFMVAAAFIGNIIIAAINLVIDIFAILWNHIANFAEFFANVFHDPIGSIVRLFAGMADSVLEIIESVASAIDTVFGSNLADAVGGWRGDLQGAVDNLVGEAQIKVKRVDPKSMHLDRFNYGAAYNIGYKFGEGIDEKVSSAFKSHLPNMDYSSMGLDIADTAANTASMKDSLSASEEDLKYMRDLAEMEVVNRFTTAEIKVELGGVTNNVSSNMDLDGVVNYIAAKVEETMEVAAEGVHE